MNLLFSQRVEETGLQNRGDSFLFLHCPYDGPTFYLDGIDLA